MSDPICTRCKQARDLHSIEPPYDTADCEGFSYLPQGANEGNWFPACGGTETEFKTRTGRRLLYCWQPSTGNHAYLDLDSDVILTDDEAQIALGNTYEQKLLNPQSDSEAAC